MASVLLVVSGCDSANQADKYDIGTLQLIAPPDNAETADAIQLEWTSPASVNDFRVQLSEDAAFSKILHDERTYNIPRFIVRQLEQGKRYFWRVRLENAVGHGEWVEPRSFVPVREATLPARPELVWPENERVGLDRELKIVWEPVDGAVSYHLQVYFDEDLLLFHTDLFDVQTPYNDLNDLVFSYPYWWRVRAESPKGFGPWSPVWKFLVRSAG